MQESLSPGSSKARDNNQTTVIKTTQEVHITDKIPSCTDFEILICYTRNMYKMLFYTKSINIIVYLCRCCADRHRSKH